VLVRSGYGCVLARSKRSLARIAAITLRRERQSGFISMMGIVSMPLLLADAIVGHQDFV
jgi:hypothetical protein